MTAPLVSLVLALFMASPAIGEEVPPPRRSEAALIELVRQDCGSCHGLTMKGGLGLPLTPEALRDKPRDGLIETVARGRPGTAMPPWAPLIHPDDIVWIVDRLRAGLPKP